MISPGQAIAAIGIAIFAIAIIVRDAFKQKREEHLRDFPRVPSTRGEDPCQKDQ